MVLQKAWDKDALVKELKEQGLPILEDSIEKVATTFFSWVKASVDMEGGMFKTVGGPIVLAAEKPALDKIDDIDKSDNEAPAPAQV